MNKDYFLKQLKNKNPLTFESNSYDLLPETFFAHDYVQVICPKHGAFKQKAYQHMQVGGCPTCSRKQGAKLRSNCAPMSLDNFITKATVIHGSYYGYEKVKYDTNMSIVTIRCPKHGYFTQRAGSHLAGRKCIKCFRDNYRLSTQEFIENAKTVHGSRYDYSKVVYLGNKKKVEIVCPRHGSFWQKPNTHVSSRNGCRFCSESKGEVAVAIFLEKYGIDYIREYRILPYLYRYDFYLPGLDIYIEFHGHQHYMPVALFGGKEAYVSTKERDKIKKLLVKINGGKLITLTYMNLSDGLVEKELIRRLKAACVKLYLIDGKLRIFKKIDEVYRTFDIPLTTLIKDIDSEVKKVVKDFNVLF